MFSTQSTNLTFARIEYYSGWRLGEISILCTFQVGVNRVHEASLFLEPLHSIQCQLSLNVSPLGFGVLLTSSPDPHMPRKVCYFKEENMT